jgi:calcium-dependent protein kinase
MEQSKKRLNKPSP